MLISLPPLLLKLTLSLSLFLSFSFHSRDEKDGKGKVLEQESRAGRVPLVAVAFFRVEAELPVGTFGVGGESGDVFGRFVAAEDDDAVDATGVVTFDELLGDCLGEVAGSQDGDVGRRRPGLHYVIKIDAGILMVRAGMDRFIDRL